MPTAGGPTADAERGSLRILFSLLHAGYLRHYGEPIRLLAERGHVVHVALSRTEKDAGDDALVARLAAEHENVTYSVTPERPYVDGWRRLAWMTRALIDLARYADPRYADATALKERIAGKIGIRVRMSRMDPVSKRLTLRFVERVMATADEEVARRHVRTLTRIEEAIPPSRRITRFVREFAPDAVVASPVVEIASFQVEILKSARRLGVPRGVAIASWDNLTNKGLVRVLPERVIVWNEIQRKELEEMHGVPPERVVLTGAQKFDKWFGRTVSTSREEFARRVGLDPQRPFLLYLCSSPFIARDEVPFVESWLRALRSSGDPGLRAAGVLVRPHPQNAVQWQDVDLSRFADVQVWPRAGEQPDGGAASEAFFDSIYHSAVVVGVNTTALIEAGIVGKSVFTLLAPEFERTQEGTLHFRYLRWENGGPLHVAAGFEEHLEQLGRALADGAGQSEQVSRFIERFCRPHGLDVPAAPLVAAAIEELARLRPAAGTRPEPSALAVRAALYPVAGLTGAVASVVAASRAARRLARRLVGKLRAVRSRHAPSWSAGSGRSRG